ncbi:MAG: right-handed parallel beta-helix repeat-containing protein [Promethearchaeota archaeon]
MVGIGKRGCQVAIVVVMLSLHAMPPLLLEFSSTHIIQRRAAPNLVQTISQHIPHPPITITSDLDFDIQGFPGNGTSDDPYRIEGYSIIDDSECIAINGTRAFFEISNCVLSGESVSYSRGILLENVSNALIEECEVFSTVLGIELSNVSSCKVASNLIWGCEGGITGRRIQRTKIFRNEIGENRYGITVSDCTNLLISSNTVHDNSDAGFWLWGYNPNCMVENNSVFGHPSAAFNLWDSPGWIFENNEVFDNVVAFDMRGAEGNRTVRNNIIANNTFGVLGGGLFDDTFLLNRFLECDTAISIWDSERCIFEGNLFDDGTHLGIEFGNCFNNTLIDNEFVGTGIAISGDRPSSWYHHLANNLVNSRPIGFFYLQDNFILDGNDYGQIVLACCEDVIIQGGEFWESYLAIMLAFSSNCSVKETEIHDEFMSGIWIGHCDSIVVERNIIYNNSNWDFGMGGVILSYASNCLFTGNMIHGNIGCGVTALGESIIVNCTFTNNAFLDNSGYGLIIERGYGNLIFGNAFGWNSWGNAYDDGYGNTWYSEELELGNWWHDYNSIESAVYEIPGSAGSVDRYPQRLAERIASPPLDQKPSDFSAMTVLAIGGVAVCALAIVIFRRRELDEQ